MRSVRATPHVNALTRMLPSYEASNCTSPPTVGTPIALPYPPMPATTPRSSSARARVIGAPEAQRVEAGDRARAHREDVAQDAADAGRRALVRLDEARVVVRLHLEDGREAVADVDDAGVLAGALDDARALGGEALEVHARRLVGAVLAPHHAEDAELGVRGLAAERLLDPGVLLGGQLVLLDDLGRDGKSPGNSTDSAFVALIVPVS